MIWIILGVMVLSALLYICAPLFDRNKVANQTNSELDHYRSQFRDIDRQLTEDDANTAELESIKTGMQRQMLERNTATPAILDKSPKWALSFLVVGFGLATAALYYNLGRADLTQAGSLQAMKPPPGPSEQEMEAAAQLTPEQRAEMIQNMVDGLSARLEENPDNPEGWVRLLRSRKVLGQIESAKEEIERLKVAFPEDPEFVQRILSETGWDDQE